MKPCIRATATATALLLSAFTLPALAHEGYDKAIQAYSCVDYQKAIGMFKTYAEQGHGLSQYMVGIMLEQGQGTEPDARSAFDWYMRAARQGIADAYFALGQIYYRGVAVPKDMIQAMVAFDVAARLGHSVSGDWRGMVSNVLNEEQLAKAQKAASELIAKRPAGALDSLR